MQNKFFPSFAPQLEMLIEEISQLFKEISLLVDSQGDMVDNIYQNVEFSCPTIAKGRGNLEKGLTFQKAARKNKMIIFAILLVILLIIILVIVTK